MGKPTIYAVFANSAKEILPNLPQEALSITNIFLPLALNDKLYFIKDEIFDDNRLRHNFTNYGNNFTIFYFSGHAKDGYLKFSNDRSIDPKTMSGIILSNLEKIKLIFLNACETFPLAKEIVSQLGPDQNGPIIICCATEVNAFLAEDFAELLFRQIGLEKPFRDAYDKAKAFLSGGEQQKKVIFREFENKEDVLGSNLDFDYGYIELKQKTVETEISGTAPKKYSSIIGNDKLTRDALSTNYLTSIVELISQQPDLIRKEDLAALSDALEAAKQVADGKKEDKDQDVKKAFRALEMPGIDSKKIFNSLINTEKNLDATKVKSYIKNEGSVIGTLQSMVNKIDVVDL